MLNYENNFLVYKRHELRMIIMLNLLAYETYKLNLIQDRYVHVPTQIKLKTQKLQNEPTDVSNKV